MTETLNFRGIQVPIHCATEEECVQARLAPEGGNMMPGWVEFWEKCFKPGDEVIDFGAHVGIFSVIFCLLGAKVHVVEGSRVIQESLEGTLLPWNGRQAIIHPVAVGTRTETRVEKFNDCRNHDIQDIEYVNWDEDEIASNISPSFVKMDIEGAETRALEHMSRLIRGVRPIWQIEYHKGLTVDYGGGFLTPEQGGFDFAEFTLMGYRILNQELKPAPEVTEAGNYFFIPRERDIYP